VVSDVLWYLVSYGLAPCLAHFPDASWGAGHYDQLKLPRPPQVKSVEVPPPSIEPAGVARRALLPALDGGVCPPFDHRSQLIRARVLGDFGDFGY